MGRARLHLGSLFERFWRWAGLGDVGAESRTKSSRRSLFCGVGETPASGVRRKRVGSWSMGAISGVCWLRGI